MRSVNSLATVGPPVEELETASVAADRIGVPSIKNTSPGLRSIRPLIALAT